MRYSDIKLSIVAQFKAPGGNRVVPFIVGAPGGGKSACAREALAELGFTTQAGNMIEFIPSMRDPVDVLGTPSNDGEVTTWKPPAEFHALRRGVGPRALLIEELPDASTPMQNAMCRVLYDRVAGELPLTDELFIVATGNRTKDKSGANRLVAKLLGRVRMVQYDENIDDFTKWAVLNDLPVTLIQFLRMRPELLSAPDPDAQHNTPSPRNWERASMVPAELPEALRMELIAGDVGEGAAAEYIGYCRIVDKLPPLDTILMNPRDAEVPDDPAVRYAITGALSRRLAVDTFERVYEYLRRLPPEFAAMAVVDALARDKSLAQSRGFALWAAENGDVLI